MRHQNRPTDPRGLRGPLAGYSLVEVVVAMLLSCIIITSVLSASLTSKTSGGLNDRRLLAAQAARQVSSRLKNFVTGCDCDIASGVCAAAGVGSCTLPGPTPRGGVASWYFNCPISVPLCSPPVTDCYYAGDPGAGYAAACGGGTDTYALRSGYHVISGLLRPDFAAAPLNARVVYRVDNTAPLVNGRPQPKVDVDVRWEEPKLQ